MACARVHVCACASIPVCTHVCMCAPVLCSIQIKSPECLLCAALGPLPLLDCVHPRRAETLGDVFTAVLNTFPIFSLNCTAALQGGGYCKEELRKGD